MTARPMSGVCVVSIDLQSPQGIGTASARRSERVIAQQLGSLLADQQIAATWGLHDPDAMLPPTVALDAGSGHEIAVLGDETWCGSLAPRSRFAAELLRRVVLAGDRGLSLRSLLLPQGATPCHAELLVKHGFAAVRTDACGAGHVAVPRVIRYGLWNVPQTLRLPSPMNGWLSSDGRKACRAIDAAIARHVVCHLVIDVPAYASSPQWRTGERTLRRVLHHADRRRQQGLLHLATLASLVASLSQPTRAVEHARSILRPAA